MERLKPLNDFIFKKLFGEKGSETILLSFLNAVLVKTHGEPLTSVYILENKELDKELINDKLGRIDVRAVTPSGEQIDIEVQLADQHNMDKRTLFYWSKLYLEGIKKGQDYSILRKGITINIVDFDYLDIPHYHTSFSLREDENPKFQLTDLVEIHFVEMSKFRKLNVKNLETDALQRWLTFLETMPSEDLLERVVAMEDAIQEAETKLAYLSSDPQTIELYKQREYAAHERANLISTGVEQGIQQGIQQGIEQRNLEMAQSLLGLLPDEVIAEKTGLNIEEVQNLHKRYPS